MRIIIIIKEKGLRKLKKKEAIILALILVLAVLLIDLIATILRPKQGKFVPPAFETAAVSGTPEVAEELGYTQLYQEGMAYRVAVCGMPYADGQKLTVYFTNVQENDCYLKLRILDAQDAVLGETGLLRPDEYVEAVELSEALEAGTPIKLKVMSYDAETYESAGTVLLSVTTTAVQDRQVE